MGSNQITTKRIWQCLHLFSLCIHGISFSSWDSSVYNAVTYFSSYLTCATLKSGKVMHERQDTLNKLFHLSSPQGPTKLESLRWQEGYSQRSKLSLTIAFLKLYSLKRSTCKLLPQALLSRELRLKYTVLTKTENPNQIYNEILQTLPILWQPSTNIETSKVTFWSTREGINRSDWFE